MAVHITIVHFTTVKIGLYEMITWISQTSTEWKLVLIQFFRFLLHLSQSVTATTTNHDLDIVTYL
jgi:hypothetical protein